MTDRKFPIQATRSYNVPIVIPWAHAEEAYKEYSAQYGTQQSLERMAERGGFDAEEIIQLLVERIKRLQNRK